MLFFPSASKVNCYYNMIEDKNSVTYQLRFSDICHIVKTNLYYPRTIYAHDPLIKSSIHPLNRYFLVNSHFFNILLIQSLHLNYEDEF